MKGDKWLWIGAAVVAVFALLPKPAPASPAPVVNGLPLNSGANYGLNPPGNVIVPPLYGGDVFGGVKLSVPNAPYGGITSPPAVSGDTTGGSFQSYQQPIIPLDYGTNIAI